MRLVLSVPALLALAATAAASGGVVQQTQLEPEGGLSFSNKFGTSVALSGDTALVGTDTSRAYVYVGQGTSWTEQAVLIGPALEDFGVAVAIDGDTAVVGAPRAFQPPGFQDAGAAYVYVRSGTAWTQQAVLTAPNPALFENFGDAVAVSGNTIAVGAPSDPVGGAIQIFVRSGTVWSHQQKLFPAASTSQFGDAVALDGATVIGGCYACSAAYVFVRNGSSWTEQAALSSPTAPQIGQSVALDGNRAVLGAPWEGSGDKGAAYVFRRQEASWFEEQRLEASPPTFDDQFGFSVAISGPRIVVGSIQRNFEEATGPGEAHVFRADGTGWSEVAQLVGAQLGDDFGHGAAVEDGQILVGAQRAANSGHPAGGSVYVFADPTATETYCTAGVSAGGCAATLSASGAASATAATGFALSASGVEGDKDGLFFFGANGRQANPWGNGTSLQCVAPPVSRAGLLSGSGTSGLCDGSFLQDLNALWCPTCPKPAHNPGAGATVQAQLWYRDPGNTSNQTTSLSDAIEFVVGL